MQQYPQFHQASNSAQIMPKEQRLSSHGLRQIPIALPSDPSGTRATGIWSTEDDSILMAARAKGLNWQRIASQYFPAKTSNACRKRHERLMARRNADDWDGPNLETLASEYMAIRREMWSILADRLGEKWAVVEVKCMEQGLKNLQAASRSESRREREVEDSYMSMTGPASAVRSRQHHHYHPAQASSSGTRGYQHRTSNMSIQAMLSPSPPNMPPF